MARIDVTTCSSSARCRRPHPAPECSTCAASRRWRTDPDPEQSSSMREASNGPSRGVQVRAGTRPPGRRQRVLFNRDAMGSKRSGHGSATSALCAHRQGDLDPRVAPAQRTRYLVYHRASTPHQSGGRPMRAKVAAFVFVGFGVLTAGPARPPRGGRHREARAPRPSLGGHHGQAARGHRRAR